MTSEVRATEGVIHGGKPFYGYDVGIILIDNPMPRLVGDVGHAATFPFPVLYEVARGADPRRVVDRAAEGLLESFIAAARRLVDHGVRAIATGCGFLAIYQEELAAAVTVPVATSSLLQIPQVLRMLGPNQRLAVLTINGAALGERHFRGVGIREPDLARVTVVGLEGTRHLYPAVIQDARVLDVPVARDEVVAATRAAVAADPRIGAFVFECTNLPPYAAAVREATARPVFDAVTLITGLHSAVRQVP
jgi:hypothetical protein